MAMLTFTAAQAAQKRLRNQADSKQVFTAAQAAQKKSMRVIFGYIGFTAAQAAQKMARAVMASISRFTAAQAALKRFMAALLQAQAEATKKARRVGISHVKAGTENLNFGRNPSYTKTQISEIVALPGKGKRVSTVAKPLGLSRASIHPILKSPAEAFEASRPGVDLCVKETLRVRAVASNRVAVLADFN